MLWNMNYATNLCLITSNYIINEGNQKILDASSGKFQASSIKTSLLKYSSHKKEVFSNCWNRHEILWNMLMAKFYKIRCHSSDAVNIFNRRCQWKSYLCSKVVQMVIKPFAEEYKRKIQMDFVQSKLVISERTAE